MSRSHTHRLRVRYADCDPQGHVFNANYLTYFDIGLTELWRAAIGPYNDLLAGGVDMVVAEATARYRSPARFDDEVDIRVTVAHLGNTSMITEMQVTRDGEPLVDGRMVHVFVDRTTMAKTEIPDRIRTALSGEAQQPSAAQQPPASPPTSKGPSGPGAGGVGARPDAR